MDRSTASLRRLIIPESIQERITNEIARTKPQMRDDGLKVIDRKMNLLDIWIQYELETVI